MRSGNVCRTPRASSSKLLRSRARSHKPSTTTPCAARVHPERCAVPLDAISSEQASSRCSTAQQPERRAVLAATGLLLSAACFNWPADAEEEEQALTTPRVMTASLQGQQVYINIKVDGKPFGRLTFELLPNVKVGAQRFADLCKGKQGVGYRLSKFDNINDEYIRNEGVKQLAYSASGVSPIAGGESTRDLEEELAQQTRRHDCGGLVSLVVKPAQERPVVEKLVAMGGKLVTVKEQAGEAPNGTAFVITRAPAPELDATNLIVARLVDGFDVLDNMGSLPVINDNQSSPFFQTGKLIGDKRALVAEKSFKKPFGKVVVSSGGVLTGLMASS